jgi:membrane fusion protein, multidrug efflux system
MPPPEVTVTTLKTGAVELRRDLPGRVSARLIAEVRPQVGGLVRKVLFTEGSRVSAGQLLYAVDDRVFRAAFQSAKAAELKAEATLDAARLSANRGTELIKNRMISAQDNDNLQVALKQAEADLAAARAAAESSRLNLEFTRITAPISGRIGKSSVTEGALVVANQADALATVQGIDEVYVDLTQSSAEWLQMRRSLGVDQPPQDGRRVAIKLEDGSAYAHTGILQFADVSVDQATGSFLLRVLVPNPEGLLMPGTYVTATIIEGTIADGLMVPQPGITRDPKGNATALVVNAAGQVELRRLSVSRTVGDQWLVSAGLAAGDRVITEGLQKVQPGMAVKPVEAGSAPAVPAVIPPAAK